MLPVKKKRLSVCVRPCVFQSPNFCLLQLSFSLTRIWLVLVLQSPQFRAPARSGCLRCDMAAEQVRRAFQDETVKTELFRLLEAEPFAEGLLLEHYPELLREWRAISDAMQVPWQYVMVCELSLASFCSPTAVLFPWNTLRVYPVLWWFLLHPGAFNTSGVIRLYSEVCGEETSKSASACFEYRLVLIRFGTSWSRTSMALARNCVINGRAKVTSATLLLGRSVPQVAPDPWKARES